MITDPRTELIQRAADNVDHIVCDQCWKPGMPSLCGIPDKARDPEEGWCPDDCIHAECPLCNLEWDRHKCPPRRLFWWRH